MDRRTFMMTGAWWSTVASGVWPWFARAATRDGTLAVVDSTLAGGPSFARYAAQLKLPTFETGGDIGALWYTTLAPLLGRQSGPTAAPAPPALIGITRASDYFVLGELVTRTGHLRVAHSHEPGTGSTAQQAHVVFAFTPRLSRDEHSGS
ncbi:hypothetical protein FVF58_40500 [Paraburkholderia panacisoli]|uniref:Uncharacterized protein n=1 Tax=Paraburkholderia panacisoli TaxID=2603818 RepID=A0A5B0GBW7_9BURK|nr:hypothetical protein [Paraburkholderia panacisoli]KAA1000265.1 hypothetical protein FVF58_40500 [Paraburkholderia panacisoli]